ncbi:putative peptide-methionine (S)-S-oxide reductase [Dictyocaulus viviparus]|uniref:peptide-methionine (S)-S-oxide reductase n=1 Tax=Dictyocaulus viviparus TaxID=29172 RepID=A0A0D8Y769_DICVI|nr:putative peptide-methionine (S)-S-oxide reductase [Dictyocaulus viviparus]
MLLSRAYLGMQCFWGESAFAKLKGVKKTRVGYAGGTTVNPSYVNIGDHTEVIEVQFDSSVVSYEDILEFFWSHHNPAQQRKKQYQSAILYETDEEKEIAEKSYKRAKFCLFEIDSLIDFQKNYHQKYWLRNETDIFNELKLSDSEVASSVLAAKMNAYCAGYNDFSELEELKKEYGLSNSLVNRVKKFAIAGGNSRACH